MHVVTREAIASDLDRAAEVLGDAFVDYPWTRWTVDAANHQQRITALQRIALEHLALPFGGVSVTAVAGEIASVVAWSDSAALSLGNIDATVPARVADLEGSRHAASKSADEQVEPLRPRQRHLYLGAAGTSRAVQGRGLATKTLAPLLQTSDDNAVEVWLETSSESNVNFYRRLGFEVQSHLTIQGGGPEVWVMARQPVTEPPTFRVKAESMRSLRRTITPTSPKSGRQRSHSARSAVGDHPWSSRTSSPCG